MFSAKSLLCCSVVVARDIVRFRDRWGTPQQHLPNHVAPGDRSADLTFAVCPQQTHLTSPPSRLPCLAAPSPSLPSPLTHHFPQHHRSGVPVCLGDRAWRDAARANNSGRVLVSTTSLSASQRTSSAVAAAYFPAAALTPFFFSTCRVPGHTNTGGLCLALEGE